MMNIERLAARLDAALQASIDRCARCKTCYQQVDAVIPVIQEEVEDQVRLARRRDALDRMEETGAPQIIIDRQRSMVAATMEKLGLPAE